MVVKANKGYEIYLFWKALLQKLNIFNYLIVSISDIHNVYRPSSIYFLYLNFIWSV
jgi:hypothetical protein